MKCQQLSNSKVINNHLRLKFFSSNGSATSHKPHYKVSSPGEIKTHTQPQVLSTTDCDCACLS
jgi:hypothetical protein